MLAALVSSPALATDAKEPIPEIIGYHRPEAPITYNSLYLYAGPFYGDSLQSSYVAGADYLLRFSEVFGIGPSFRWGHANYPEVPAYQDGGFIKTHSMYMTTMVLMVSMPAAYQVLDKIVES